MASAPNRRVLIAGATGLVGHALLEDCLAADERAAIHLLLRRPPVPPIDEPRVHVHLVDFAALPALPPVDVAFIALGTTIRVAGSPAAFRRVDLDAVVNIARAARDAGARALVVVSAHGADPQSRVFYNRTKGEMQAAVAALGVPSVTFVQPSLLVGDRAALGQPPRRAERWALRLTAPVRRWLPSRIRPIEARRVAIAMRRAAAACRDGIHVISNADMLRDGD